MAKSSAVEQSLVAVVPHSDVSALFGQFLARTGGGKASSKEERRRRDSQPISGGRQDHPRHRRHEDPRQRRGRRPSQHGGPRQQQQLSQDLLPQLDGYQLIGDSMMSRLGSFATSARPSFNKSLNANQLGLCVSGQTTSQLLRLLKSKDCPKMAKKGILMIGTNNVLKQVPLEDGRKAFTNVVETLKRHMERLIIMTIPPIPKLMSDDSCKSSWTKFNEFIKSIRNSEEIFVYDCSPFFFSGNTVKHELFEQDRIHWNRAAMQLMMEQLKEAIVLS